MYAHRYSQATRLIGCSVPFGLPFHTMALMIVSYLQQTAVSGAPPSPRSGHSAIAFGDSLVIYGGMNGQDGFTFNDLYELRPGGLA